jgi:hypothetical protein
MFYKQWRTCDLLLQGPGMWPVMRGSAATGTVPRTTCEFDFAWDHVAIAEAANKKGKGEAALDEGFALVRVTYILCK